MKIWIEKEELAYKLGNEQETNIEIDQLAEGIKKPVNVYTHNRPDITNCIP